MQIDAVITWVDGTDKFHQQKMLPFLDDKKITLSKGFKSRYGQVEEVKFVVNSIIKYAPFIQNIYIVTDNQTPNFIKHKKNNLYKNVFIINHESIFKDDSSVLPVFNSRSIETKLYDIPNLSENFIYFNDDLFLIREAKISDFFIENNPVIRGKWLDFNENIFYKRLFNSEKKKKKAGHKKAQELSAKMLGFKKYFKFHHTPFALRKSTFINFFTKNKEVELLNIKHKFRQPTQFIAQGLANHLEIKNKTAILKESYQLIYFQNYKKPFLWLKFKLLYQTKQQSKLFLCMQSLDQCPKRKQEFILNWLEKKYELK